MSQLLTGRSVVRRGALALAACATVAACVVAPSVRAGGFDIGADVPRVDSDPRLANSVLVFHVGGCHAFHSTVNVRAIGMVRG